MLVGELYDPLDPQLCWERQRCRLLCQRLNEFPTGGSEAYLQILHELFLYRTDAWIKPPFFCDYGTNIAFGTNVVVGDNCVVLDSAPVFIGDNVRFEPSVQIHTATHPVDPAGHRQWLEAAEPIIIGSDVRIGRGAIICPGVTIGEGSVIGEGSYVTKSIPPGVIAKGNPCTVVRELVEIHGG
jgi:maltose O-acetyltransferase